MTPEARQSLKIATMGVNLADSAADLEAFCRFVRTKDEQADGSFSVRPFPTRLEKAYVWAVMDALRSEKLVMFEKSRQLLLTWTVCVFILWVAKFQANRLIFVQSKKEEDAANLVFNQEPNRARISFIENNLPEYLRSNAGFSYGKMAFPNGSLIWGVPEGGDILRSYTASIVFSDELAFQDEAEAAWGACRPMIGGRGQFIGVSTARAGAYMQKLIATTPQETL